MTDPAFTLRAGPSGPVVIGTPGYVLTFDANGRTVSGQPGGGGGGAVTSVFGRPGPAVVAQAGDYDASEVTNDSSVTGASVAAALDALQGEIAAITPDSFQFKVDSADTTPNFFTSKVLAGDGIAFDITNPSANEQLTISAKGIPILEISESLSTGDYFAAFDFALAANGGAFIECTFADWNPGDLLEAEFWATWKMFDTDPATAQMCVVVSLDAGANWFIVRPACTVFHAPAGTSDTITSMAASASVSLATKPIVRLGFLNIEGLMFIDYGSNACGITLRCKRYPAGSFSTLAQLVPFT